MKKLVTIVTMAIVFGSAAHAKNTNIENKIINIAAEQGWQVDSTKDQADNKVHLIKKVKQRINYDRLRAEVSYADNAVNITTDYRNAVGSTKQLKVNKMTSQLKNAIEDALNKSM